MKLYEKIPVKFEGNDYEIRVLYDDTTINVVAFLNNHPANGFRHQIQFPKKFNGEDVVEKDEVKELVELSKNDIIQKRWEKFMETI